MDLGCCFCRGVMLCLFALCGLVVESRKVAFCAVSEGKHVKLSCETGHDWFLRFPVCVTRLLLECGGIQWRVIRIANH